MNDNTFSNFKVNRTYSLAQARIFRGGEARSTKGGLFGESQRGGSGGGAPARRRGFQKM